MIILCKTIKLIARLCQRLSDADSMSLLLITELTIKKTYFPVITIHLPLEATVLFVHSFIHSIILSLIHYHDTFTIIPFNHATWNNSVACSFFHSVIHSFFHSFSITIHSPCKHATWSNSVVRSFIHSFIHSFFHSLSWYIYHVNMPFEITVVCSFVYSFIIAIH